MSIHKDLNIQIFQEAEDSNGVSVSVFDVPYGDNSGCYCPVCKEPVGAKNRGKSRGTILKANQKAAHFYHHPNSNCSYRGESQLHKLAKQVFEENLELLVPSSNFYYEEILGRTQRVKFDDVFIEERIYYNGSFFQIDAIAIKNDKVVLLEFVNTSYIKESKEKAIIAKGLDCLEIDLKLMDSFEDDVEVSDLKKELAKFFLDDSSWSRDWIYNNKYEINNKNGRLEREKRRREEEKRKAKNAEILKRLEQEREFDKEWNDFEDLLD